MEETHASYILLHSKRKYRMAEGKEFWFNFTKKNKQNKICLIKQKKTRPVIYIY